jgi:hypothetical protein
MKTYSIAGRAIACNNGREGLTLKAEPEGLRVGGWYDSMVAIESAVIPWADIDDIRKKAKALARRREAKQ